MRKQRKIIKSCPTYFLLYSELLHKEVVDLFERVYFWNGRFKGCMMNDKGRDNASSSSVAYKDNQRGGVIGRGFL